MVKELILKIMERALEINSKQKNTIFIRYSGHVDGFEIEIYKNGWKEYKKEDYSKCIYMCNRTSEENLKELTKIIKELDKIKELSITDQSHDSSDD